MYKRQAGGGSHIVQDGLLPAGEEADHQSGALLELEDRLLTVGNVAQRGGGEDRPVLNVEGIQDGPEAEQGVCGPVEALPAHGAVLPNIAGQAGLSLL